MVGPVHLVMPRAFFHAECEGKWCLLCLAEIGPGEARELLLFFHGHMW